MLKQTNVSFCRRHSPALCSRHGGLQGHVLRNSWCVHKAPAKQVLLIEEQMLLLEQLGPEQLASKASVASRQASAFIQTWS